MSLKLEIGSGNRPLPGYQHLDIDPACPDLDYCCGMDEIPCEDNTFMEVMSVHSIEHIGWRKGRKALIEWLRVLAPGGKLHIATPNLEWLCRSYLENGKAWGADFNCMAPEEKDHLTVNGFHCHSLWMNFKLYSSGEGGDEHMACYDKFLLAHLLTEVGYVNVRVLHDGDSLIMEAHKP